MREPEIWPARLERDGLIRRDGARFRTTRRWQGAMSRAALALAAHDRRGDLRAPVALALLDVYGRTLDDEELVAAVAAMLPIERAELACFG